MSISRLILTAALTAGAILSAGLPIRAGTVGDYKKVDENGGWNPDAAFDPEHGLYLVVWSGNGVCGRFVDGDGALAGATFRINDAVGGGLYPAVAYNPARDEFLVTWDSFSRPGQTDTIWGQRLHSPDGVPVGGNFQIGTRGAGRSQVAWGSVSQCYMVVYGVSYIFAQRVSGTGVLLGSEIDVSGCLPGSPCGWYPAVSYSPGADAFLVSWDAPVPGIPGVGARRYAAATGAPLDTVFAVSPGVADRSHSAHDDGLGRWLVLYQDQRAPADYSYDQYVRFVNNDGTPGPESLAVANSPLFEGETNLGCDIAFSSGANVYLAVYGMDAGMFAQLLDRNGNRLRGRVTLALGDFTYNSNAADPTRDRFLAVFSGNPVAGGTWHAYYRLYAVYTPISGLLAVPEPGRIRLSWTQPDDSEMTHATIRFSTVSPPADPAAGSLIAEIDAAPGTGKEYVHSGLTHREIYYYAVFASDGTTPIYAPGVATSARPDLPGDLDYDGDVDQEDFGLFQVCMSGAGRLYASGCASSDMEGDGDVDQDDLTVFMGCLGGPGQSPGC